MARCCDPSGYDAIFGERFARRLTRRYRKRGLSRSQQRMVDFLTEQGIEGATVLEIGGGVGELQVELLRRGAARATNLEIATGYEHEAAELLERNGFNDRVVRRQVDIAQHPERVESADVVILHRVVCCYPDYERLLGAAGGHARRLLVFSHPPRNAATRSIVSVQNLALRLTRHTFQTFAHPPEAMLAVLRRQGLRTTYRHRGLVWQVAGLQRD